jgi:phosphoribosyl-ATP pyrophosphohydrolase/phosphoribosyl-AMP cyclohydrolase
MSKARKVKVASKGKAAKPAARPAIHKVGKKAKPEKAKEPEPRHEPRPEPGKMPAPPKGAALARLAAMAAAAASDDEPEVEVKSKSAAPAPKGGVQWEDLEDDDEGEAPAPPAKAGGHAPAHASHAPPAAAGHPPAVPAPKPSLDDGIQLVARTASKFSLADIEALRAAVKIKGATNVVDGVNLEELKYDGEGLIPVVLQDRRTGAVLTVTWANKETLADTLQTKKVSTFDRVRQKSVQLDDAGRHQHLHKLLVDCEKDSVLLLIEQEGPACHRDTASCFAEGRTLPVASYLGELDGTLAAKAKSPDGSVEAKQLAEPIEALRAFVGACNSVSKTLQGEASGAKLEIEAATVLQSLLVACRARGVGLERLVTDLYARHVAEKLAKK